MAPLDLNYQPQVLVDAAPLSRAEWLEYRRKGLGGSDVAAALGVSPYMTMRDLYLDKKGLLAPNDDNWVAMKAGRLLEGLVAEIFSRRMKAMLLRETKMFYHPFYPFMLADIDRLAVLPDGRLVLLECKTANPETRWKWADGKLPNHYELQCRHYLAVLNIDTIYICCLFTHSDKDYIMRRIDRDLSIEEGLIGKEQLFWDNYVLAGKEPPYTETNAELVLDSISKLLGPANPAAEPILLSEDSLPALEEYIALQKEKSEYDKKSKELQNRMGLLSAPLREAIGFAPGGFLQKGDRIFKVSYANSERAGVDQAALARLKELHPKIYEEYVHTTSSRTFRLTVKEIKKKEEKAA